MSSDLSDIQPGDILLVTSRYPDTLATVERVTKTQVTDTRGVRYRKDGRALGGNVWDSVRAQPATEADRFRVRREVQHRRAFNKLTALFHDRQKLDHIKTLPYDTLMAAYNLLTEGNEQ